MSDHQNKHGVELERTQNENEERNNKQKKENFESFLSNAFQQNIPSSIIS